VALYAKISKKGSDFYEREKKKLFFNEFLSLSLEGFFEFMISGYLNYKKNFNYSSVLGERISNFVAYSCII
jgi:hypothetical protein